MAVRVCRNIIGHMKFCCCWVSVSFKFDPFATITTRKYNSYPHKREMISQKSIFLLFLKKVSEQLKAGELKTHSRTNTFDEVRRYHYCNTRFLHDHT